MQVSGIDDLGELKDLHEAPLLHNLILRYSRDQIYTYTGVILIAVNPYKAVPGLYSEETAARYFSRSLSLSLSLPLCLPASTNML